VFLTICTIVGHEITGSFSKLPPVLRNEFVAPFSNAIADRVSDLAEQENRGHLTPPNQRLNPDPKKGAGIWPQICAENGVRQQWVDIFLALDLGPENGPQKRPAKRTQQQGQTA